MAPIKEMRVKLLSKSMRLLTPILLAALTACSAVTIDNDSPPEKQYAEGERLLSKDRYIEAVERFRILKSRFPHSKYAALATLRIGDVHFAEEAYIEAAGAYKIFRELYPKHEMTAYAVYRIGESNNLQVPDSPDRDIDAAYEAITAFSELVKNYPTSPFADDAKKKIDVLRSKLAEKEDYIGDFYFIRENFSASANRYRHILETYPGLGHDEKSLYRLAYSYEKTGDFTRASEALDRLQNEFPKNKFSEQAKELAKKIASENK